jgi:hypothetical protein
VRRLLPAAVDAIRVEHVFKHKPDQDSSHLIRLLLLGLKLLRLQALVDSSHFNRLHLLGLKLLRLQALVDSLHFNRLLLLGLGLLRLQALVDTRIRSAHVVYVRLSAR